MAKTVKDTKSKEKIGGCKRQVKIENAWLLYNYETLRDWFWTRKSAVQHALWEMGETGGPLPEHYQILRGTITVEIDPPTKN
jgi:hypothetical protein